MNLKRTMCLAGNVPPGITDRGGGVEVCEVVKESVGGKGRDPLFLIRIAHIKDWGETRTKGVLRSKLWAVSFCLQDECPTFRIQSRKYGTQSKA